VIIGLRIFWQPLWHEYLAWREKQVGVLRRGILLTPKALVVRLTTNRCNIIPRASLFRVRFHLRRPRCWRIDYRTSDRTEHVYDLEFAPYDRTRDPQVVLPIRQWANIKPDDSL
jgi:hypothetical protein